MELRRGNVSELARRISLVKELELHSVAIIDGEVFDSTMAPGVFDFNSVIRTTVGMLSYSLNGINPVMDLHESALPVKGDSAGAIRIMHNLLINSRNAIAKAKREEQSRILVVSTRLSADFCRIEIGDNGCGMVEGQRPSENGHHGLGLQSVRESLDRLKGTIQITSSMGEGTIVSLILPLCLVQEPLITLAS
jgi:signal transduction histidine kinase